MRTNFDGMNNRTRLSNGVAQLRKRASHTARHSHQRPGRRAHATMCAAACTHTFAVQAACHHTAIHKQIARKRNGPTNFKRRMPVSIQLSVESRNRRRVYIIFIYMYIFINIH